MTAPRREWLQTFADPAILSDLFAAARDAMGQVCDHEPSECSCELNRATFQEWAEWVAIEAERSKGEPLHLRPAGQPGRKREGDPRLNLAVG